MSGMSSITSYLSITKNEARQAALMVKSSPAIQRAVTGFLADSVNISSPADLLNSKNQAALQVVLGAYNMAGMSTETGLLSKLLTQDPSAKGSLVQSLGSTSDLHFVKAMTDRAMISMDFGDATATSFVTGGKAASSISFNNLGWGSDDASLTAASPAVSWSYVLNDGTAAASIATALTTAVQSTGTADAPVTASYSVDASGVITGSSGAPAISTSTNSAGNTVYSLTLASSGAGAPIRMANVISVAAPVPPVGSTTPTTTSITAAAATSLLSGALDATGFSVTPSSATGLNIINPIDNTTLSVAPRAYTSFVAISQQPINSGNRIVALGTSGLNLSAGQTLMSGSNVIGTIKSVDGAGNVTLTAATTAILAAGSRIDVSIGIGVTNIGTQITATAATTKSDTTLALGSAALGIQSGQVITDGSNVIGIVKSVDASGNVTLQASANAAIAKGDSLSFLPQVTDQQIPALLVTSNVTSIVSQYEINQYETAQGKLNPGMDSALYFTRTAPAVTSITQLMSDPILLKVITTDLGLSDTYGMLPYDQQVTLLTSKVKLSDFSSPTKIQNYAERFLALTGEQAAAGTGNSDPAMILLTGGTSGSTDGSDTSTGLVNALYPGNSTSGSSSISDPLLAALYA